MCNCVCACVYTCIRVCVCASMYGKRRGSHFFLYHTRTRNYNYTCIYRITEIRLLTGARSSSLTLCHVIKHTFHGFAVWEGTRSIVTTSLLISFSSLALVCMEKEHQLLLNLLPFFRVRGLVGRAPGSWWQLVSTAREKILYGIIGTRRRWCWNSRVTQGLCQTGSWRVHRVRLTLRLLRILRQVQIFINLQKNSKHSTRRPYE